MKASLNFANMNVNVRTMLSNCQLSITALAEAERALKQASEAAKKAGKGGEALKQATTEERALKKEAKDRATTMCEAFIIRHMSVEDITKDIDLYHFDMVAFLQNIGVISEGDVDKKIITRVTAITNTVIDRKREVLAGRKSGEDKYSAGEVKEVKNNAIDLVAAFIYAAVDSGAMEYCGGGIAVKDFSKK